MSRYDRVRVAVLICVAVIAMLVLVVGCQVPMR